MKYYKSKGRRLFKTENLPEAPAKHTGETPKQTFSIGYFLCGRVSAIRSFSATNAHKKKKSSRKDWTSENKKIGRAFFYFLEKFSPPQTGEFFESQKEEHFHFSKNSPGETGTSFCLKKSLNIAKMVEKRFELPTSTHDLSYEKIRLADCHKIPIFSDKSENPHARVTGVHKFLTLMPPLVLVDNHGADHQEMKPL